MHHGSISYEPFLRISYTVYASRIGICICFCKKASRRTLHFFIGFSRIHKLCDIISFHWRIDIAGADPDSGAGTYKNDSSKRTRKIIALHHKPHKSQSDPEKAQRRHISFVAGLTVQSHHSRVNNGYYHCILFLFWA